MMTSIEASQLAAQASELLRQVGETGHPVDIVENGVIVARVLPVYGSFPHKDLSAFWSEWDSMAQEIGEELERHAVTSVDAVELMHDIRD